MFVTGTVRASEFSLQTEGVRPHQGLPGVSLGPGTVIPWPELRRVLRTRAVTFQAILSMGASAGALLISLAYSVLRPPQSSKELHSY